MAVDLVSLLTGPIGKIGEKIADKLLRGKMSEGEIAEFHRELLEQINDMEWQDVAAEFEDRADARALAMAETEKANAWTMTLSAVHRPIWGFVMLIVFVSSAWHNAPGWLPVMEMTELHQQVMLAVVMFYFGGRTAEIWRGGGRKMHTLDELEGMINKLGLTPRQRRKLERAGA